MGGGKVPAGRGRRSQHCGLAEGRWWGAEFPRGPAHSFLKEGSGRGSCSERAEGRAVVCLQEHRSTMLLFIAEWLPFLRSK